MVERYTGDDSMDLMPNHWPKKEGKYSIPTKFSELRQFEGGDIDSQLQNIGDLILSYNTAKGIDFDASLDGGGGDEEGEEGDGAGDEEEEEDEDE